jgi:hypothetical protein
MKRMTINKIRKAQQKIILLCFIILLHYNPTWGQIRFVKNLYGPENYWESAIKMVEMKDFYLIPIQSLPSLVGDNSFYILKLSSNGKVLSHSNFGNWDDDRGPLFNANDNLFWKLSTVFDTSDYEDHFRFSLFDSELNELLRTQAPRTCPSYAWFDFTGFAYLKLSNGDFIFTLYVSAINWPPFNGRITSGFNFIYITKNGEIKANKTFNAFRLPQNVWQLNDTSVVTVVSLNGCTKNCYLVKVFDFKGNEILTKALPSGGFQKKCGKRYYGFKRSLFGKFSFLCYDENFELISEKELPINIYPFGFWDNEDNNDFRVRVAYSILDSTGYPTNESYETMMDTSFTWQKLKLPSGSDPSLTGLLEDDPEFYPTSDGGALYVFEKTLIVDYDQDLVFVKVDTNWVEKKQAQEEESLIYPNPNNSNFLVIKKEGWQTVTIYDLAGRVLFKYEYNLLNYLDGINIQDLQRGNYYLQIVFPDKTVINKFIRY